MKKSEGQKSKGLGSCWVGDVYIQLPWEAQAIVIAARHLKQHLKPRKPYSEFLADSQTKTISFNHVYGTLYPVSYFNFERQL